MNKEEEILNTLFAELGAERETRKARDTKIDYKSKWPLYEVKGTHGSTWDVFETLQRAKDAIASNKLRRYEIWQVNEAGQKVLVERSHNEAGFGFNSNANSPFSSLQGLKYGT